MAIGAKFLRADLHIHSFGEFGSFDVTDNTMTPQAIVDTAIANGLSIISITDHNEIQNSNAAISYSAGKNILVIPGIEVSTTQGHLLLYFDTFANLRAFYGKLTINNDKTLCQQGITQCLDFAEQHNGIGILAHIELSSGFEKTIAKFNPQMDEIFKHKNLYGLEITNKAGAILYTDSDEDVNRKRLINLRRTTLNLDEDYNLPKLMSSDSHTLSKLGLNAEGEKKLTRIKVDELNYHAFKIALLSQESRIRLEEFIPDQRPLIKSITIEGGLLDKITVNLSPNLTCIIGSRGAGKSTLLETIRETSGNKSVSKVVNSDVWPQKISLVYEDEAGQIIHFSREKNSNTQNLTDPINGISKVEIKNYGQGETAETLQHSDTNPLVLVNFLDTFLDLNTLRFEESDLINKLRDNQSESRKLRLELLSLDETKKALLNEQKKLANLEKEKAGELVKYQNALIKERQIRNTLIEDLKKLISTYREILSNNETFENFEKLKDDEIIVGKDYFKKVKNIVAEFSKIVSSKSGELNESLNKKVEELNSEFKNWTDKEKGIQEKIDTKKKELEALGIPFDLGKINQISKDIIDLCARLRKLENSQKLLKEFETLRLDLITKRDEIKRKIFSLRYSFAETINKNLTNSMDGLFINVKYDQGKLSDSFEKLLKSVMDWRTSQVSKAYLISLQLTPLEFVSICKRNNAEGLKVLVDENNNRLFSDAEISVIIARIMKEHCYEDFEAIEFEDRPTITVTKIFKDEAGQTQRNSKLISQLSLGQQQSVLLGILMLSKSRKPLIIDQPEDNLDSEFIFKTIVKNLRKIKESRQVIIVTHNPNIAVLGDAELIIPLKSTSIKSHVLSSGSIDRKETREICCEILEGGKSAFKQRLDIYGIK
ncbi:MAG: AAA family ATPase [Bacteroidota bacterium]|nr:AAA family ATPase [Bacteroidota bacterium]MDP3144237.1 AAA family ATPase [Bacteroidota bacterium]